MSSRASLARRTAVALLAVVALAGCQDDDGPAGPDGPDATPSQRADGSTAPGTVLAAGETATVTRTAGAGTIEVTVLGIEQGDPADLRAIGYERADEVTPYYLRVAVTPVSGSSPFQLDDYLRVWGGGRPLDHLTITRPFAPCQETAVGDGVLGERREHCLTYVRTSGEDDPDAAYFDNDDTYDPVDGTGIEWTLPAPGRA
ncbi:hypothetical protein [Nocardioides rubriscoriae]|uniref:hypothetical protein n=1 Tax=Nocardioides rubriscoriae TaxID=642762 RepID=UPI0011E04B90|nr:hypothetical protein [Nocardioides rubriscoriae]